MAFDRDPFVVLGLPAGARPDEVKRAYRRLAKAYHPDAAGPGAMARFLAIQAAYEQLTGQSPDATGEARGGRSRRSTPRPSWQAEADRARSTRDGWGNRRGPAAGSGPRRGSAADGESRPGDGTGARRGGKPGGSRGTGGSGSAGTGGSAGTAGSAATGGASKRGRDGQRRRATPGSTSYDEADHEPFDPEWSGASWYGQTSGTYWTLNPREYADPRKHGPEYQARARRATEPGGDEDPIPGVAPEDPGPEAAAGAGTTFRPHRRPGDSPRGPGVRTGADAPRAEWGRGPGDAPPPGTAASEAAASSDPPFSLGEPLTLGSILQARGGRLALALVGWPPLGLGLAWLAGELSGCGRFSAMCAAGPTAFALGTWLAQLVVIGLLLVIPWAAAVSAVGTVGMLAVAVPAAVILSISGGTAAPESAAAALAVFLALGYAAGAGFAIVRRSRTIRL